MSTAHQFGEELQEERDQEQTNMHTIVIGIGSDDDAVVAQSIESILDVECRLQEIKFLILIDDLLALPVAVEGLPS